MTHWLKTLQGAATLVLILASPSTAARPDEVVDARAAEQWPEIQATARPWAYWYWFGGIVDEAGLTQYLEDYRQAGLGGVHIVPIYGVRGYESRNVNFLSPRWMELLAHTTREADRLGMKVDMTCGTGWPFGGPWVQSPLSASQYSLKVIPLDAALHAAGPVRPEPPQDGSRLEAIMAYGPGKEVRELTDKVDSNGKLDWQAPSADWRLTALFRAPTNFPVERAAPGGEGATIDFFSRASLENYVTKFDDAFALVPDLRLRALYSDSYENWGENWTPRLFDEFERRRGYDLKQHLVQLDPADSSDDATRLRADYRETVAELIRENFAAPWVEWAHGKDFITRNQAHGAPGNPLDLYAQADIPETEVYGTSWLKLLGLKPLPGVPVKSAGAPEVLFCKLAPSAAHVAGRKLCASESCTWLGEHFKIPLEHMKCQADLLFVMGVNHILFHGAPYSPQEAPWPGWLWYASTNIGPYLPAWDHIPALFEYIARCQSCLQSGQPDNEVLVYLPMYDLWATDEGARDGMQHPTADDTKEWMDKIMPGFVEVGHMLWDRGFGFDLISDRQIATLFVEDGQLTAPGGKYRVLILPECHTISEQTLESVARLVEAGATIVVQNRLPKDVPGLGDLNNRRRKLQTIAERLISDDASIQTGRRKGHLVIGPDVEQMLAGAGVLRESLVDFGLEFIRRRDGFDHTYFIVNCSDEAFSDWLPLSVSAKSVVLLDPATAQVGLADSRSGKRSTDVYLQLHPKESVIIRTSGAPVDSSPWKYRRETASLELAGNWQVTFVKGGPTLPMAQSIDKLTDWTTWTGDADALKSFAGVARYRLDFQMPAEIADAWSIDLGKVCHSARVSLNGRELGTLLSSPYRIDATQALRPGTNQLEIQVANLPANRIAELDRRGVDWKPFYFVDIKYRTFDASAWPPTASGLIGPVRLIAEQTTVPSR